MRKDSIGLFWQDAPKSIEKPVPPEPLWLLPDYLPDLVEARAFKIDKMTDEDVRKSLLKRDRMLFDIEVYPNYFLASFRSDRTGKVLVFEMKEGEELDVSRLKWILENFTIVGFNSLNFDIPITTLALDGCGTRELKAASDAIIVDGALGRDILKRKKIRPLKIDHIDLIEVAPLKANLKIYGARLHTPKMQDLPFDPATELSDDQIAIVRWYNVNSDLTATGFLHECLRPQIELRTELSKEFNRDLRSKSDAQIAEAVISEEYFRRTGRRPERSSVSPGTVFRYKKPSFLAFESDLMKSVLETVSSAKFVVGESGSVIMPEEIKNLKITIGGSTYQMGIGGLHSTETCVSYAAECGYKLVDKDVTSYYPFIILNCGLFPPHLGPVFLDIYREIVERRVEAKRAGIIIIANAFKIVVNGAFGKLASKYSFLYAPDMLFHVTLTGQLSLLMLIEAIESAGMSVVSANTDGIVIRYTEFDESKLEEISKAWESATGFSLEDSLYRALYSRDVNNYLAIGTNGKVKRKGAFSNPWTDGISAGCLHKNPTNTVCIDAVEKFLLDNTPIETTITTCRDIRKFVTVRTVKGGAAKVWPNSTEHLGKSIRWYYSKDVEGNIVYAASGNRVPRSEGARPCLVLPEQFPIDLDYQWYINESKDILKNIGHSLDF